MLSTCGNCKGHIFEIQEVSASGAIYKKYFLQCSSCGVPAGVTDYFENSSLVENLEKKISHINSRLEQLDYTLNTIAQSIRN